MKCYKPYLLFLTVVLVFMVSGCASAPEITKLSENQYSIYYKGGVSSSRSEVMTKWTASAKEACKGGEYDVIKGPDMKLMSDVQPYVEGTIKCK